MMVQLVVQSPATDCLCVSLQQQTLARFGSEQLDLLLLLRWSDAFNRRQEALAALLQRWGLSLPRANAFAGWSSSSSSKQQHVQQQHIMLQWQQEEPAPSPPPSSTSKTPGIHISSSSSSSSISLASAPGSPVPCSSPRTLTEVPLSSFELFSIPRQPQVSVQPKQQTQQQKSSNTSSSKGSSSNNKGASSNNKGTSSKSSNRTRRGLVSISTGAAAAAGGGGAAAEAKETPS